MKCDCDLVNLAVVDVDVGDVEQTPAWPPGGWWVRPTAARQVLITSHCHQYVIAQTVHDQQYFKEKLVKNRIGGRGSTSIWIMSLYILVFFSDVTSKPS